jgi:molybdopterin converting factor subunit 1
MTVTVLLFARYREAAGERAIAVDLPEGASLAAAWAAVQRQVPALAAETSPMMALDQAYRGPETSVQPGSEIAFFPPVSGG